MEDVGLVIFDEFHERSLQADFAFALARDVQQSVRDDLPLLVMSATLALEALEKSLPKAHFVQCSGRQYPVDISYQPPTNIRLWREHAKSVIQKEINQGGATTLVFLPSSGDIQYLLEELSVGRISRSAAFIWRFTLAETTTSHSANGKKTRYFSDKYR